MEDKDDLYLFICFNAERLPYSYLNKYLKKHEVKCWAKCVQHKFPSYSLPKIEQLIYEEIEGV